MIKYTIITLCTSNCINTIISDFFEGDELYRVYYLKDEPIIILYNIVCIMILYVCIILIIFFYHEIICMSL